VPELQAQRYKTDGEPKLRRAEAGAVHLSTNLFRQLSEDPPVPHNRAQRIWPARRVLVHFSTVELTDGCGVMFTDGTGYQGQMTIGVQQTILHGCNSRVAVKTIAARTSSNQILPKSKQARTTLCVSVLAEEPCLAR
jgi:hypothetical protein